MCPSGTFVNFINFIALSRWWFQIHFIFHPYLGKIPNLTSIFFRWVETTNQLFILHFRTVSTRYAICLHSIHLALTGEAVALYAQAVDVLSRWGFVHVKTQSCWMNHPYTGHGSDMFRYPANSPVEVGSLSHYLQTFSTSQGGWPWDFSTIISITALDL